MKITNKMCLPKSLVNACQTEPHNKEGEVSATTLLKGAKQFVLERRHWDEMEDDVSDRLWALFGTAVHKLLEDKNPDAFTEERFSYKVGGLTLTGQVDLYDMEDETIYDYKTASVWKVILGDFDDWWRQGMIYAWLMDKAGIKVRNIRFVAMLRDWSKGEAERNPDYPRSQVYVYKFDVTYCALTAIEDYIKDKVAEFERALAKKDDEIEPCTAKERWEKETKYAVMKDGRKSAVRVFETEKMANEFAKTNKEYKVVERKGASVRCENYCLCREFCSFYKKMREAENEQ